MATAQVAQTPEQLWLSAMLGAKLPPKPEDPLKDVNVDEIRDAMTFSMEKVPRGAVDHLKKLVGKDTAMKSLDKKGDAMKEIDTEEDTANLKSIDKANMAKASEALAKITAIKDKALAKKFKDAGYDEQKLAKMQDALETYQKTGRLPQGGPPEKEIQAFEKLAKKIDGEVGDEVFEPLVRQGAMPENLVPDRFSKMKRTFEGASKAYEGRLQKYAEENGDHANLIRKLGVSQDMIDKASQLGTAVLAAIPNPGAVEGAVKLAAELMPLASGLAINTTQQIMQKKDPQDIVNSILSGVGSICSQAIPNAEIATIVSGSITAAIAGGKVVRSIKNKDPKAALEALAGAATTALSTAGSATGNDKLSDLAPAVIATIVTGVKAKAYADALKKGDEKEIKKALAELMQSGIEAISKGVQGTVSKVDTNSQQASDLNSIVQSAASAGSDFLSDDGGDNDPAISDEDKEKLKELKKTIKEQDAIIQDKSATPQKRRAACKKKADAQLELQENRAMLKKLAEADDPDFLDISKEDLDNPDDDTAPPQKLQEMILQLQKDQKIFKLVDTLSSLPLQVAAEFFPPAGAALSFRQFAVEVMIAVKHTRALMVWRDNAANAKWGASPQVHAMLSRVGMAERRAMEHQINAALHLTAGVGSIVTTVGAHAAPVGVAMTAAAKVGLATAALAKVAIDEAEMERGWRLFQAALKNPKNRKAARRAIEGNPTLAKYSLAWGALEGGDAFAKSALKTCGLTPRVLETEGANVQEVQKYLETMFDEDLVILRAVPEKKAWYPSKKPVLTFLSWTSFLGAATTDAKPPLAKGSGGAVSEAFVNLNAAEQKFKAATKQLGKAEEEREKLVKAEKDKSKAIKAVEEEADKKSKIAEARQSLTDSKKELKEAVEALQSAATSFIPLNETDKKEHVEMREYLDALVALGDLKLRELNGKTVALDTEEEAEAGDEEESEENAA